MTNTHDEPLEPDEAAPGGDPGLDPDDPDAVAEPDLRGETDDPGEADFGAAGNEGPMNLAE